MLRWAVFSWTQCTSNYCYKTRN